MPPRLRSATTSIVVVGEFNPAIFHPYWFGARDLLPSELVTEARATVQALMNEVMTFETDWLTFQAVPQRIVFTSKESAYRLELRDLAMGTLTLQADQPVRSLGLNRDAHYRVDNEGDWHEIGDRFVPNEPWAGVTGGARAGLLRLVVQVAREGHELSEGATNIQIGPSSEVEPGEFGVFLGINDHYDVTSADEPTPASDVVPLLEREWEPARERANAIARHIIGKA